MHIFCYQHPLHMSRDIYLFLASSIKNVKNMHPRAQDLCKAKPGLKSILPALRPENPAGVTPWANACHAPDLPISGHEYNKPYFFCEYLFHHDAMR